MRTCKQPRCAKGATMGIYCIQHWYTSQGKQPPVNREVAIAGRQPTSARAAVRALPRTGTTRQKVYDLVKLKGGLTSDEIQAITGISPNTINPTIRTLVQDGWLYDSRMLRPTRAGNDAIVWAAE